MNWAELEADWSQKGMLVKSCWAELDAADLQQISGNRERLAAALQRRYAMSAEAAETAIREFEAEIRFPGAVK